MKRLVLPAAAVVVLLAWGYGSRLLPAPPVRVDIMVSAAVVLSAAAALVWGMLPLAALGRRLPLVALAALPCAALFVWLGWVPWPTSPRWCSPPPSASGSPTSSSASAGSSSSPPCPRRSTS